MHCPDHFRRLSGLIVFSPSCNALIAYSASLARREREALAENCFACDRISSKYFGSTTFHSREVSSAGSSSPALPRAPYEKSGQLRCDYRVQASPSNMWRHFGRCDATGVGWAESFPHFGAGVRVTIPKLSRRCKLLPFHMKPSLERRAAKSAGDLVARSKPFTVLPIEF